MDPLDKRKLGKTPLELSIIGFGGAPLGGLFDAVDEDEAKATVSDSYSMGTRYFDTAPFYGYGLSEHRMGEVLRQKPRGDYVQSTKVGRLLKAKDPSEIYMDNWAESLPFESVYDYGYDATMRSIEDSYQRLGTNQIDIAFIHDIGTFTHGKEAHPALFKEAIDGGFRALDELRSAGVIKAIGMGVNEWEVCEQGLRAADFDCFLLAGRYTLLEQESLNSFLPLCEEKNVGIVIGGAYNSGILATGAIEGARFNYAPAPQDVLDKVSKIEAICDRHGVSLKAAALQFPLYNPLVASVLPGSRSRTELNENFSLVKEEIPVDFWQELKHEGLMREDAATPTS